MKSQRELFKELDNARECRRNLESRLDKGIRQGDREMARQYLGDLANLHATIDSITRELSECARNS